MLQQTNMSHDNWLESLFRSGSIIPVQPEDFLRVI